ncbi:hypothetical protein BJV82DRAFT_15455 [Fennellomyces sp. T-0311]|nr:hypothetical protein BJV82DRAFT_15455 [Fennellomyces sp. T-0311]
MHPAVFAAIVVGGVIVLWGGYEFASRLIDEREERRQYDEYVRRHHRDFEKSHLTDDSSEFSNDDDDGQKRLHREYESLRRRRQRPGSSSSSRTKQSFNDENLYHSAYELTEMEKSILDRRQRLQMEQAMLDEVERDLQRRREVLASRSASIDENDNNPFFRPPPPQEVPELPPRPQFSQELPSFFSSAPEQKREIIFDSDSSSNSSTSEHPSLYQSTGGLDASTTDLGPRIDALQAPSNLTPDADWSDVVGNRPRAQSDLSDNFSQLSVHSSKRSISGESSVSYDMLSMTDLDDARSQR